MSTRTFMYYLSFFTLQEMKMSRGETAAAFLVDFALDAGGRLMI